MTVNVKNVIRMMGILLFVIGICIIPSLIVAIIYQEKISTICFAITMTFCLTLGFVIMYLFPPSLMKIKARDGFLIVSLCWLVASLISAVPLWTSHAIPSYIDAFFEMCSGYSTTGSTCLKDVEILPKSMYCAFFIFSTSRSISCALRSVNEDTSAAFSESRLYFLNMPGVIFPDKEDLMILCIIRSG